MVTKKSTSSKIMEDDPMPETEISKDFISFFVDELKDTYWAEKRLARSIPKIQKAAKSPGLKDALTSYLTSSQIQAERLEQIFEILGITPRAKKSEAIASLLEETDSVIEETGKRTNLRDSRIVLATQKAKQYEISTYTALVQLARTMGNEDIIALLEETLSEEIESGELLTTLAEDSFQSSASGEANEKNSENIEKAEAVYDSINLTGKNIKTV